MRYGFNNPAYRQKENGDYIPTWRDRIFGKRVWIELTEDLVFTSFHGTTYIVPAGFTFDGASVPQCLWWIVDPYGEHLRAACLHDWMYRQIATTGEGDRQLADSFFRAGMHLLRVSWFRRNIMYLAVRAFGWLAIRTIKED